MLSIGTKIRLVREMGTFPFRIGTIFTVDDFYKDDSIIIKNRLGIGIMTYDDLEKYFEIAGKSKWTDWVIKYKYSITFGETSYNKEIDFKYRHNCKIVELMKDGIKVRSYCHKDDMFDLEKGIEVALAKFEIKKEENKIKKLSSNLEKKKKRYKEKYCKEESTNGTIHNLGTLYIEDMKIKRPTRPWDLKIIPPGYLDKGNIFEYNGGDIEIRNTDDNEEYQLQWIEVNYNNKKLLICDRNILIGVSWDELKKQNLIEGKMITIDNKIYSIRLLNGGINKIGDSFHDGALPTDNEWDRIICSEGNLKGVPIPLNTDLDSSLSSSCYSSSHNKIWNWTSIYSWCKETYSGSSSSRVIRGYYSANYFNYSSGAHGCTGIGWRPVLEVLE